MTVLVIASGNQAKERALKQNFWGLPFEMRSQSEWNYVFPKGTDCSFEENALIKARSIARQTGLPALADDSRLMVHTLE